MTKPNAADVIEVDRFVPNWRRRCIACDCRPTVEAIDVRGQRVRVADLCGPCTFGTARAADPAQWDRLDD